MTSPLLRLEHWTVHPSQSIACQNRIPVNPCHCFTSQRHWNYSSRTTSTSSSDRAYNDIDRTHNPFKEWTAMSMRFSWMDPRNMEVDAPFDARLYPMWFIVNDWLLILLEHMSYSAKHSTQDSMHPPHSQSFNESSSSFVVIQQFSKFIQSLMYTRGCVQNWYYYCSCCWCCLFE